MSRYFRAGVGALGLVALASWGLGASPAVAAKSEPGTATVSINGTTYTATADKGGCAFGRKFPGGIPKKRYFKGTDGSVEISIRIDPKNASPTSSEVLVESENGDFFWEGYEMQDLDIEGRSTAASFTFVNRIVRPGQAASGKLPGTVSFTC